MNTADQIKSLTIDLAARARAVYGSDFLAASLGYNCHPGCRESWRTHICLCGRDSHHIDGDTPQAAYDATIKVMEANSVDVLAAVLGIPVEFASAA